MAPPLTVPDRASFELTRSIQLKRERSDSAVDRRSSFSCPPYLAYTRYSRPAFAEANACGYSRTSSGCGSSFHHSVPLRNFARKPIDTAPGKSNVSTLSEGLGHESLRGVSVGSGI